MGVKIRGITKTKRRAWQIANKRSWNKGIEHKAQYRTKHRKGR